MDKDLLGRYTEYASSEEARAILFVKEYLKKSKGNWVDIIESQEIEYNCDENCFRYVEGRLYKRKLRPKYPPKSNFKNLNGRFNAREYRLACRAITWKTANRDIKQQKSKNIIALRFEIKGTTHESCKKGFFADNAPKEIKALEKNLQNRTNPLWDIALKYANKPKFVCKIKDVKIYRE